MKGLVADGFNAASIHGNKSQGQRDRAIKAFRDGTITVLVATDVAARGIDIPGVAYVINYDLPEVPDNYVHRIGRTARAGREGEAIAFCAPEEVGLLRQIQKLMKIEIPVASGKATELAEYRSAAAQAAAEWSGRRRPMWRKAKGAGDGRAVRPPDRFGIPQCAQGVTRPVTPSQSPAPSTRSGFVGGGISTPSNREKPNRP
jgi:ATP-dependent RNA helicase RhlE